MHVYFVFFFCFVLKHERDNINKNNKVIWKSKREKARETFSLTTKQGTILCQIFNYTRQHEFNFLVNPNIGHTCFRIYQYRKYYFHLCFVCRFFKEIQFRSPFFHFNLSPVSICVYACEQCFYLETAS